MVEALTYALPLRRRDGSVKAVTLIDPRDWDLAKSFRWYLGTNGYVMAKKGGRKSQTMYYLHRVILGLRHRDGLEADHRNRDRLDNRRRNLKACTRAENAQNVPGYHRKDTLKHSRHRGVAWSMTARKWEAYCTVKRKKRLLGFFEDEDDAAEAARIFRRQHLPNSQD